MESWNCWKYSSHRACFLDNDGWVCKYVNGLWSVYNTKGTPSRKQRQCFTAKTWVKVSFSDIVRLSSGPFNFLEKYAIRCNPCPWSCWSTAAMARSDASAVSMNSLVMSGYTGIGVSLKAFLSARNDCCCASAHSQGNVFCNNLVSGAANAEKPCTKRQ